MIAESSWLHLVCFLRKVYGAVGSIPLGVWTDYHHTQPLIPCCDLTLAITWSYILVVYTWRLYKHYNTCMPAMYIGVDYFMHTGMYLTVQMSSVACHIETWEFDIQNAATNSHGIKIIIITHIAVYTSRLWLVNYTHTVWIVHLSLLAEKSNT